MDFAQELLASPSSAQVAPELLETLGNQAAMAHLSTGTPLNDVLKKVLAEHGDFNNEHIKRVVEFANNRTFKEMFERDPDKNVHFAVADPGMLIRDLRDGSAPAYAGKNIASSGKDYSSPPPGRMEKTEFGDPESALQQLFKNEGQNGRFGEGEGLSKLAHANPVEDVYDAHVSLQSSLEALQDADEHWDGILKEARQDLYREVEKVALDPDGLGFAGAVALLEKLGHDTDYISMALSEVAARLTEGGVDVSVTGEAFDKIAHLRTPNPGHPINLAFCGLIKAAEEKVKTEVALVDVRNGLEQTSAFLRAAR